jgi:hypothetical protein
VSDSDREDDVWDEDWGEDEGQACVSLFSDFVVLPSVQACCEYDARHHEFDLRKYIYTVRTCALPVLLLPQSLHKQLCSGMCHARIINSSTERCQSRNGGAATEAPCGNKILYMI